MLGMVNWRKLFILFCATVQTSMNLSQSLAQHFTWHVRKGKTVSLKILVDHGADVKLQGGEFETALIAAAVGLSNIQPCSLASILYDDIIALLLRQGADVNVCSSKYGTALDIANRTGVKGYYTRALLKKHGATATL